MKEIKFPFSVVAFTLLTIFVLSFFMGMTSSQPLSIPHQGNWKHYPESRKKEVKRKRIETEKKREVTKKIDKKDNKEKEGTNTLVAFEKSTSYLNHKKRYWLSPILLGLKEVTDKDGKTYKLDKITEALKKIPTKTEWKYWRANETTSLHWHLSESDLLHPGHHFFDIKGEGRKQLLSLLEKGTGKPLGIVTKIKEKITEYQIKFFESIRPELMKLKNSIWSPSQNSVLKVTAGVQVFYLHWLMKTKNLATVSYKNLDKWTKSQLIGISIRANGLEKSVEAFRDGVAAFLADNKIKIIGSNYQIDFLSEEANIELINSKTLFDNFQISFSKNINNNEYQINKTEIKKKNPNPENSLPKTTSSLDEDKLKKPNSTYRELQEHTFSLDEDIEF